MYRWTARLLYIVHSPRGVNFNLSAEEAISRIQEKYGSRWFGAQIDYLGLQTPSKEFLPFYLCSGRIHGVFTGTATYSEPASSSSSGKQRIVRTQQLTLDSVFEENRTQLYAGYKYNIAHVHYALKNEANALQMQKMSLVDTTDASIHLFEQSTLTMRAVLEEDVRRQATATALSMVRTYHPTADVSINFCSLTIKVDEITPCFVPCYVTKALYDGQEYRIYVSGLNGNVGGPYLLNSLYIGRAAATLTLSLGLFLTPNKVAGLIYGLVTAVGTYYAAFFFAKWFPLYRRDYNRRQREALRMHNTGEDTSGYRPKATSQRIRHEYHNSSYWDSHEYQQRPSSSNSSSTSTRHGGRKIIRDVKGYYKILGLQGNESINEIRSEYRKLVLKQHPDIGGSTSKMANVNEAYRVLRDTKRRAEYDAL